MSWTGVMQTVGDATSLLMQAELELAVTDMSPWEVSKVASELSQMQRIVGSMTLMLRENLDNPGGRGHD